MKLSPLRVSILVFASALLTQNATAQIVWDEAVDGELSDNFAAPTPLTFSTGGNVIIGSVTSPVDRRDLITFTVPVGRQLTKLRQLAYFDIPGGGAGDRAYHALNAGATTQLPTMSNGNMFLGGAHIDTVPVGTDLLPVLGAAAQAGTGFSVPLGAGTYTYTLQQTGAEEVGYELDFRLANDPDGFGTRYCDPAVLNSTGLPGKLTITGSATLADSDVTLSATQLPPGPNIGYFIMGTGMNTFTPTGSSGPICVAPGLKRFLPPVENTTELGGGFTRDVATEGVFLSNVTSGSTWNFQAWHRDGMNPSNLTDAVGVTFN